MNRYGLLIHTTPRMNLKNILRERSQTPRTNAVRLHGCHSDFGWQTQMQYTDDVLWNCALEPYVT